MLLGEFQVQNKLNSTLESVQYNATLVITRTISGSSREKLYQELSIESLKPRRWYQKLCLFSKLKKKKEHLSYLFDLIPKVLSTRITRNHHNIPLINVKHEYFQNSFSHPLLLSEISSIIIFEMRNLIMLLKRISP